jgi:hypothetical protein
MASRVKFSELLGPRCRERDLAYALLVSPAVAPRSTLATIRWWKDTSPGVDFGIATVHTDEVYAAMDRLVARQDTIEKKLAGRHLTPAEWRCSICPAPGWKATIANVPGSATRGRGNEVFRRSSSGCRVMSTPRPVAVRVFAGNTSDARSFLTAISAVRDRFGLQNLTMVGDRGMITNARVADLASPPGLDWITALRAPAIAALARDDGPLQRSLFDTQNFAEITHHDFPGERLGCPEDSRQWI